MRLAASIALILGMTLGNKWAGAAPLTVTSDAQSYYLSYANRSPWQGSWPAANGTVKVRRGHDMVGEFMDHVWTSGLFPVDSLTVRAYLDQPVAVFIQDVADDHRLERFPDFAVWPNAAHALSYAHLAFAPMRFDLQGEAPWVFYEDKQYAAVLSPLEPAMLSNNYLSSAGHLGTGLEPQVQLLGAPQHLSAILAFGSGINAAYQAWGQSLTAFTQKPRILNDATPVLASLGYWSDNRSSYWYNFAADLGYAGTLQAVYRHFRTLGIPLGHLQLDSWWYTKGGDAQSGLMPSWQQANYGHGIYTYDAAPELFPDGLGAFAESLHLPLITHSRWIDPSSPYIHRYRMSKQVSIDPDYWEDRMAYLQANGVDTYEQDWLNDKALPRLDVFGEAEAFLGGMAEAAARHGLSMQYCMPLARHFMQSVHYPNLLTIRASGDGFDRSQWTPFLFGARLASAVGAWPFTDVVFSHDRDSLRLATLSGGIVGIGDHLPVKLSADSHPSWCKDDLDCQEPDVRNLRQVIRRDGVVVKPDTPLLPTDESYSWLSSDKTEDQVMVATATSLGPKSTSAVYLFAYPQTANGKALLTLRPSTLGIPGPVVIYDQKTRQTYRIQSGGEAAFTVTGAGLYLEMVPLTEDGTAVLGDLSLFVPLGRQRLQKISENEARYRLTFAPGETSLAISVYSSHRAPSMSSSSGSVRLNSYEQKTGLATFLVRSPKSNAATLEELVLILDTPSD